MTESILGSLMKAKNVTQVQLAKELGVSRQTVARWVAGYPISEKNIKKLAEFFDVTEEVIRYGKKEASSCVSIYDEEDLPPDDVVVIKEYKLTFGAHSDGVIAEPEWVLDEEGEEYWYKRSFFQERHLNPNRCKRASVHGDSMEPTICDRDKIMFYEELDPRPGCVIIADGQIYTMSIDGLLKIKRLSRTKDGIIVRSDNSELYPPEIFTREDVDRLRIFGRVIEINRTLLR